MPAPSLIPLSLYIHIPWCERKCPYCDFNSHEMRAEVDETGYIDALLTDLSNDLSAYAQQLKDRSVESIFIGGGTPSLFSAQSINRLLIEIEKRIPFQTDIEVTLEANPGSAETEKFHGFRQAGVNRLSIGVQSFNDQHLKSLGRVHDQNQALKAAHAAHAAKFDNFNLDLMFGLPNQTIEQAIEDLASALSLQASHLSCYQLTIEPNTLFHHRPPPRPDNEALWDMQLALQTKLKSHEYQQYEVSAYSLANKECRHNTNYWQFGDYLGIGAGAHSKISSPELGVTRAWKIKHPAKYIERCAQGADPAGDRVTVETDQLPFEFMLNALRLSNGFEKELFEQRTFLPLECISHHLRHHQDLGLIQDNTHRIQPSARGKTMIDSMLQDYLT